MIERMTTDNNIEIIRKYSKGKRYLEIGVYRGGTLLNTGAKISVGIDNFSQFDPDGVNKKHVLDNIRDDIRLIEGDCYDDDTLFKALPYAPYDVFFYDGDHLPDPTRIAIIMYSQLMKDTYTLIVDDWNVGGVRNGTYDGLKRMKYTILEEYFTGKNASKDYWNGIVVFKVEK